jgi:hypothetical protein
VILAFLADLQLVTPKERDAATAKLMSMDYRITFFDAPSLIEAVHLSEAKPWTQPLKTFIQQFSAPNIDLKALIPILVEALVRLYREPLLPESRVGLQQRSSMQFGRTCLQGAVCWSCVQNPHCCSI